MGRDLGFERAVERCLISHIAEYTAIPGIGATGAGKTGTRPSCVDSQGSPVVFWYVLSVGIIQ